LPNSRRRSTNNRIERQHMDFLQPPGWPRARGYSNGIAARGRTVCISGMIGWDAQCQFHTDDLAGQVRQALENIVAVLAEAGAGPQHIVRMTWYVLDKKEYVDAYPEIGVAYRDVIGRHYPTMSAVQVAGLIEDRARVEIEVTAIVED
jgi:enamine deaminase RidA (YjgF/YER057c/UK114 family)